jgi:phosphatidate cytidylyltransferase
VAGADPAHWFVIRRPGSELALRIASGLLLAPLAVALAYIGGWPFAVFWGLAAIQVFAEWTALVSETDRRAVLLAGSGALVFAVALAGGGRMLAAVIVVAIGALGMAALAPATRRLWAAAGVPYAGAIGIAPIALRADDDYGFLAVVFLFVVVWTTDIAAYFTGRALGGPKLMPRVSPKKTWSGALGGAAAAVIGAFIVAKIAGLAGALALAGLALALSILVQAGDLFESFLKRRFGAKDSGQLIPGHGGLMDRLDGFVAAAVLAAVVGLLHGGLAAPGRGLVVW